MASLVQGIVRGGVSISRCLDYPTGSWIRDERWKKFQQKFYIFAQLYEKTREAGSTFQIEGQSLQIKDQNCARYCCAISSHLVNGRPSLCLTVDRTISELAILGLNQLITMMLPVIVVINADIKLGYVWISIANAAEVFSVLKNFFPGFFFNLANYQLYRRFLCHDLDLVLGSEDENRISRCCWGPYLRGL